MQGTIHWRDWSDRVVADAASEHKVILLSLVTTWSEECSVMDAVTFSRSDVSAIAAARFVPIRVDADRRPDLSERYNLGGWPTVAFLTPDGHVLNGGTYFGPDELIAAMNHVADAWRDCSDEIRARIAEVQHGQPAAGDHPDASAPGWFRSLLLDEIDRVHGGFGAGPKSPHAPAMRFAMMVADAEHDAMLTEVVGLTLDGIDLLWDAADGGFYRYANGADWTNPATEKTLEDNAAVLGLLLDAAVRFKTEACRERAADLVRWVKHAMADEGAGGFFNSRAAVSKTVDRAMYVDRNAEMIAGFLRASAVFDDPWLRDFALQSLEAVIVPAYVPGDGVAHEIGGTRGLLGDQVCAASALIWAHDATGQLPYSMLAAELMEFCIRSMWDEQASCFRDRVTAEMPLWPFVLNCDAACVLDRLATMTGHASHRERAVRILARFSHEYQRHGIFAAPYALAVREVIERSGPPGLNLSHVDWHLDKD